MEKWKLHAKLIGLENWSKQNLYIEENDIGQSCISTRWVVTKKLVDGETITKARLCARGFEETQEFRTDSPCCTTTGIRTALAVLTTNNWHLKAADAKTAFLQGKKIEREVYIRPPEEAATNKVWKLQKCAYGLGDASRYWYLRVKEELINVGGNVSSIDPGIFYGKENNELIGILVCHVDDIVYGGTTMFENSVIQKLKQIFKFGCVEVFGSIGKYLHI